MQPYLSRQCAQEAIVEQSLKNDFAAIQKSIANNFTNAFMGVNVSGVVKSDLGKQNLENCYKNIKTLAPFVQKYSQDYMYRSDATLMEVEAEIEKACRNLINNTIAMGKSLENENYTEAINTLSLLKNLEDQMLTLIKKLESNNFYLIGKKECNRMLIYAATLIEAAANKAQKDFYASKEWILLVNKKAPVANRAANIRFN